MIETTDSLKAEADLTQLIREVSASPFIAQLTSAEVQRYLRDRSILFFYELDEILGFAAWQKINPLWSELGPMYIVPKIRGSSLGTRFAKTVLTMNTGKRLFIATRNPLVKKFALRSGFHAVGLLSLPHPILIHQLKRLTLGRLIAIFGSRSSESVGLYITRMPYHPAH